MELSSLGSSASSGDIYKQMNALRLYVMQLKDELETELGNIGYENLNTQLQKRLDNINTGIEEISASTETVAQDVSKNYDSSTSIIDGARLMNLSVGGSKITDLTILGQKLAEKTIGTEKLKGILNDEDITSAEWVNIKPVTDISYEDGVLTFTTTEMTVLKSGIAYTPEEHTITIIEGDTTDGTITE